MSGDERIAVTFPNGNVLQFPTDLYLFFETATLAGASPAWVSKVGLVVTEEDDLMWQMLYQRQYNLFLKRQDSLFTELKFTKAAKELKECSDSFLMPFLEKVTTNAKISQWPYFNPKAATLQLFNVFNCVLGKLKDVLKQRRLEEDEEYEFMLGEMERDVIWSLALLSTVWSFGAMLSKDLRKYFEEIFQSFKRKFNINMSQSAAAQTIGRQKYTLFDIYFDLESLQWELFIENMDYKLKMQHDALSNSLMLPTVEVSQTFFVMDTLIGAISETTPLEAKHFRAIGPSGTGKSFAVNAYLKKATGDARY